MALEDGADFSSMFGSLFPSAMMTPPGAMTGLLPGGMDAEELRRKLMERLQAKQAQSEGMQLAFNGSQPPLGNRGQGISQIPDSRVVPAEKAYDAPPSMAPAPDQSQQQRFSGSFQDYDKFRKAQETGQPAVWDGPPPTGTPTYQNAGDQAAPAPTQKQAKPMQVGGTDRDLLIRTVIGEANQEPELGKAGVAHVVLNRLNSGKFGQSMQDVLFAPKQFEPWNTRRNELLSIDPNSSAYRNAAGVVDQVLGGQLADPTKGALNFANVGTVQDRGNTSAMRWINDMMSNGSSVKIGNHTFGTPGGSGAGARTQVASADQTSAPQTPSTPAQPQRRGMLGSIFGSLSPDTGAASDGAAQAGGPISNALGLSPSSRTALQAMLMAMASSTDRRTPFANAPALLMALQNQQQAREDKLYGRSKDQRDFELRKSEIDRSQQNADRGFGLQQQQFDQSKTTGDRSYDLQKQQFEQSKTSGDRSYDLQKQQFDRTTKKDDAEPPKTLDDPNTGDKLQYDPEKKRYVPLQTDGVQLQPGQLPSVKLTEQQSKDLNYVIRGRDAHTNLSKIDDKLSGFADKYMSGVPVAGNYLVSPEYQQAQQYGREFLSGVLRKDSGAAITKQEEEIYGKVYLPQPGDSPTVIAQKRAAREKAMSAMRLGLGPAEKLLRAYDAQQNQKSQSQAPAGPTPEEIAAEMQRRGLK